MSHIYKLRISNLISAVGRLSQDHQTNLTYILLSKKILKKGRLNLKLGELEHILNIKYLLTSEVWTSLFK